MGLVIPGSVLIVISKHYYNCYVILEFIDLRGSEDIWPKKRRSRGVTNVIVGEMNEDE